MISELSPEIITRLEQQQNIWFATVRQDGRPHLVPVWYLWHAGKIYIGTDPKSIKVRNLQHNSHVSLALEDGTHPVIFEGTARHLPPPWDAGLLAAFFKKYEWDLPNDPQYNDIWEITPLKWRSW